MNGALLRRWGPLALATALPSFIRDASNKEMPISGQGKQLHTLKQTEIKNLNKNYVSSISEPRNALSSIFLRMFPVAYCNPSLFSSHQATFFTSYIPQTDLTTYSVDPKVMTSVSRILRYLDNPEEWKKRGIAPPKGIILCGPPGVGKTELAKKLAGHAQVPFFQISAPEILRPFVGEEERILRELFQQAKQQAPCIIFIDEFDTLAQSRNNARISSYKSDIVNQLLTLLSGDNDGVIVMAATNSKKENLDSALIRPGRFDAVITLELPSEEQRMQILTLRTQGKSMDSSVDLPELAKRCKGFSGADIALLVNEAALQALENGRQKIAWTDMEKARRIVKSGFSVSHENIEHRKIIGGHEAGHAVVGEKLGFSVTSVSIKGDHDSNIGGITNFDIDFLVISKERLIDYLSVLLGGRAAEKVFFQKEYASSSNDIDQAKEVILRLKQERMISFDVSESDLLEQALQKAMKILENNQEMWQRVQSALVEQEHLERTDFMQAVNPPALSLMQSVQQAFLPSKTEIQPTLAKLPPPKPKNQNSSGNKTQSASSNKASNNTNSSATIIIDYTPKEKTKHPALTKENIAKALGIDDIKEIKRIEDDYSIEISLKLGFDKKLLNKIKEDLYKNRVECYIDDYFENHGPKIKIYQDAKEDFIEFVEKTAKKK